MINMKSLVPTQAIFSLFGSICNNPTLLIKGDVKLTKDDFYTSFHKVVFFAINNLVSANGTLKSISSLDIDTYLQSYEKFKTIWESGNGLQYIEDAKDSANDELFNGVYHTIKKMSVLRTFLSSGFDISELYNPESIDVNEFATQQRKLQSMTEDEIVNFFTAKALKIKNDIGEINNKTPSFKSGDHLQDIIESFKEAPGYGYPFFDGYYNTLFNGMQKGKFMIRSGNTGTFKSRQALKDMLMVACDQAYLPNSHKWKALPEPHPCLFISTELAEKDLELINLSYITRIAPDTIKNGVYTKEQQEIIAEGIETLKRAPFYFCNMENFDVSDIENTIKYYIMNYGVEYVVFDYMQMVSKLSSSVTEQYGAGMTTDRPLLDLASSLWSIAHENNVFLLSATQVNGYYSSDDNDESRTQNVLRGSKGIADKIDYGLILARPRTVDLKNIKNFASDLSLNPKGLKVNFSHWVYKNRDGDSYVVIWSHFDGGLGVEYPLFVTDYQYNLLDIPLTKLNVIDGVSHVKDEIVNE